MRQKDAWTAKLIYYSSEQIICRGTSTHAMRFTKEGQLFYGELDSHELEKIENYGKIRHPEEVTSKINTFARNFKQVK